MSKVHDLKILTEFYEAKLKEVKQWELRLDDRGFAVGDILYLREIIPIPNSVPAMYEYTGRVLVTEVLYILRDFKGLADGYVIMSDKVEQELHNDFSKEQ